MIGEHSTVRPTATGFTLVEMLVVVLILSILALIALQNLTGAREKAQWAAMRSDLRSLASQQELYYSNNNLYAADFALLLVRTSEGVSVTIMEADSYGWAATASHQALPAEQCGIYYGRASASNAPPAAVAGLIGCTGGS